MFHTKHCLTQYRTTGYVKPRRDDRKNGERNTLQRGTTLMIFVGNKEDNAMKTREEKINALFEELVPASGKAATVAGEIIRAISRIGYRNYNDGDHLGVGYGRETCNPAGRYLAAKCDDRIARLIRAIWGEENDSYYEMDHSQ